MWLLDATTRRLKSVNDPQNVKYAILSYTWGDDEVLFDDIHKVEAKEMAGCRKIDFACRQARKDNLQYVWIDTCCIDKGSSAELSEAINSMYRWYSDAQICYGYLADIAVRSMSCLDPETEGFGERTNSFGARLPSSRWFSRSWTLQELLAPAELVSFDTAWTRVGSKASLCDLLSDITGISGTFLEDRRLLQFASIARRMSWAAKRESSRVEDQAYALLGIFDINMPLLYREGSKAFLRLQEEIVRSHDADDSILIASASTLNLFATSPAPFEHAHGIIGCPSPMEGAYELTRQGLRLNLLVLGANTAAADESYKFSNRRISDASGTHDGSEESSDLEIPEKVDVTAVKLDDDSAHSYCLHAALESRYRDQPGTRIALILRRRPTTTTRDESRRKHGNGNIFDILPGIRIVTAEELEEYKIDKLVIARRPMPWPAVFPYISIALTADSKETLASAAIVGWQRPGDRWHSTKGVDRHRGTLHLKREGKDSQSCDLHLLLERHKMLEPEKHIAVKVSSL
ncbi:hypothetical protein LTR95_017869 [Oleoguttula sp. CCFEE 5521]